MNRLFMFLGGLLLMFSLSGCCLTGGCGGGNYCGYPPPPCGSCGSGGCGVAPGGYPSAMAPGFAPTAAFAPGYQQAAFQSIPTHIN